jgi:hypothetical protein
MIAWTVLSYAIFTIYALFLVFDYADTRYGVVLAFRIMGILSSLAFNIGLGYLFSCRKDESLKLWSAAPGQDYSISSQQPEDEEFYN